MHFETFEIDMNCTLQPAAEYCIGPEIPSLYGDKFRLVLLLFNAQIKIFSCK